MYLNQYCRQSKDGTTVVIVKMTIMGPNLTELADLARWSEKQKLTGVSFELLKENLAGPDDNLLWFETHPLWPKGNADSQKGAARISCNEEDRCFDF